MWNKFKTSKFYANYKEELVWIPSFVAIYLSWTWMASSMDRGASLFDFVSIADSIISLALRGSFLVVMCLLILRVAFPPIYNHLHEEFYHGFTNKDITTKDKYAVVFFLVILLSLAIVSRGIAQTNGDERRVKLEQILSTQLNIRETWGPNKGKAVNKMLLSVGAHPGDSWCGAYVGYDLTLIGVKNPNSKWSPNYALQKDIIWTPKNQKIKPLLGDVPTFWHANLHRVGHVGFFLWKDKEGWFVTQEGNTNNNGSFNGDGVYKKKEILLKFMPSADI